MKKKSMFPVVKICDKFQMSEDCDPVERFLMLIEVNDRTGLAKVVADKLVPHELQKNFIVQAYNVAPVMSGTLEVLRKHN